MHRGTIKKEVGTRHLFAAARYSLQGFQRLVGEAAFRHEALAFGAALVLFALVGAALVEYVALFVLAMVLFAFEAINTAIEELVDRVSPEISSVGKHAKDLGSFACFCLIVANGALVAYVVLGRLLF
ncbi:diacylglycerol kinase [Rhizobiaceae bacterium n13]|uniref:Diacylglycerol kinase n=1 Tax=Ferirhizobium litorale TaxID=2927786 RepID=A0AAE3QFT6_9HYPH|nr:diacylglycerol kinase [Fererhizobium litorale]MDI7864892.1 diacylglycerol kinase [Fererhizobium litorale]MDI7925012.1 diacylglycerol kinase [Fererhizobium litorale]